MSFLSAFHIKNRLKTKLLFASLLISTILINESSANKNGNIEGISFCGDNENNRDISKKLIYVTTLDGRISALDLTRNGEMKWSVSTGPGGLLSSSIHRLELTNNGKWVRMIPSLSGSLYKFDGESIEPIPITADDLLKSSFKFSDDLVISGGKETRSYGVSVRTGQVLYECTMHGCKNGTEAETATDNFNDTHETNNNEIKTTSVSEIPDHNALLDDVIVVRRSTQTVRAVEPRTGHEKWNFSIGHHELDMLRSEDCRGNAMDAELDKTLLDLELKVIVPEGVICAVRKSTPTVILWKHKFDFPIVSAWRADNSDELKNIDLFNGAEWLWNGNDNIETRKVPTSATPSLYLGMFQKQLYIQESDMMIKSLHDRDKYVSQNLITDESPNYPRIPWKPYPATSLAVIDNDLKDKEDNEIPAITALSVLYGSEYVNGNGFYLFGADDVKMISNGSCDDDDEMRGDDNNTIPPFEFPFEGDTPVKVIIVSLWFWWKEIIVISLTTAFIINLLLNNRIRTEKEFVIVERHIPIPMSITGKPDSEGRRPPVDIDRDSRSNDTRNSSQRSISESVDCNTFTSRFSSDFDLVRCLGRGGFGVVFEAKNKIDDCNYAIKRIILPNKKESRDRVMREVKTLANCEHKNIVRYFNTWIEQPPPGWQENQDRDWIERDVFSTSIDIDSPSSPTAPSPYFDNNLMSNNLSYLNNGKQVWLKEMNISTSDQFFDKTNNKMVGCEDDDDDSFIQFKENPDEVEDDDDSFIVFRNDEDGSINSNLNDNIEKSHDTYKTKKSNSNNESEDDDSNMSCVKNNDLIISINNNTNSSLSSNDSLENKKPDCDKNIVPFKKTHRRPNSLDLTSRGNVIFNSPVQTPNKMYLYIQMQLCHKQSLKDWLKLNNALELRGDKIMQIFEQIVGAVEYVHLKGLIHRDLKPSNILFSLDGQIKIGDFGLVTDMSNLPSRQVHTPNDETKEIPNFVTHRHNNNNSPYLNNNSNSLSFKNFAKHTEQVGTHLYMSPEQIQGLNYNYKVDIYSLGLIFFELLICFDTEMERIRVLQGLRENKFPEDFRNTFNHEYDLLQLMLSTSPNRRPTTFGIRARKPLAHSSINKDWHFELPPRRRESSTSSSLDLKIDL